MLGGVEPQGNSRVGQTVFTRLIESQIWHLVQLFGSVWGGFRKGTMASAYLSVWEKAVAQLLP